MVSESCSKPSVWFFTYSISYNFSKIITFKIAFKRDTSLPGLKLSDFVAYLSSAWALGSRTNKSAPLCAAFFIKVAATG